jgi:hypothetical protein
MKMERVEIHTYKNNERQSIIDVQDNWSVNDVIKIFESMQKLGFECRVKRVLHGKNQIVKKDRPERKLRIPL